MESVERVEFRTTDAPRDERHDRWREHVSGNHGRLGITFADHRDLHGSTRVQRAGEFQCIEFASGAISYRRLPADIRRDEDLSARMIMPLRGAVHLSDADHTLTLRPGMLGVLSWGHPVTLAHDSGMRGIILTIPPTSPAAAGLAARTDGLLDPGHSTLPVVAAMARALAAPTTALGAAEFVATNIAMIDLLDAALSTVDAARSTRLLEVARAIRAHVAVRTALREVTVESVAEALGLRVDEVVTALALAARLGGPLTGGTETGGWWNLPRRGEIGRRVTWQRARDYMTVHADDPTVTVASVARALGVSRRLLHYAFDSAPEPPGRLLRRIRLERALVRLRGSAETIGHIGAISGFGDERSFREAFRRQYGVSPGHIRRHPTWQPESTPMPDPDRSAVQAIASSTTAAMNSSSSSRPGANTHTSGPP